MKRILIAILIVSCETILHAYSVSQFASEVVSDSRKLYANDKFDVRAGVLYDFLEDNNKSKLGVSTSIVRWKCFDFGPIVSFKAENSNDKVGFGCSLLMNLMRVPVTEGLTMEEIVPSSETERFIQSHIYFGPVLTKSFDYGTIGLGFEAGVKF